VVCNSICLLLSLKHDTRLPGSTITHTNMYLE